MQHRSSTRPFFTTSFKAFNTSHTLEPHTTHLLDILFNTSSLPLFRSNDERRNPAAEARSIDIQALFLTYTMDVATDFLFGKCVNGLRRWNTEEADVAVKGSDGDAVELAKAFAEAQVCTQPLK